MINNFIPNCLVSLLITLTASSLINEAASNQPDDVYSAIDKLSEAEIFGKSDTKYALKEGSSIDEGKCKLKLTCYKCCVGEGPKTACKKNFDNWQRGKNCGCK